MEEIREFVKSLKRLYGNHMISEIKINELYNENKITKDEKLYVLEGRV